MKGGPILQKRKENISWKKVFEDSLFDLNYVFLLLIDNLSNLELKSHDFSINRKILSKIILFN